MNACGGDRLGFSWRNAWRVLGNLGKDTSGSGLFRALRCSSWEAVQRSEGRRARASVVATQFAQTSELSVTQRPDFFSFKGKTQHFSIFHTHEALLVPWRNIAPGTSCISSEGLGRNGDRPTCFLAWAWSILPGWPCKDSKVPGRDPARLDPEHSVELNSWLH